LAEFKNLSDYFSLWGPPRPVFGTGDNRRQVYLFIGVIFGAIAKNIYDALTGAAALEWKTLVVALIASFVVFPQLYYSGGLNRRKLSFAHWTFAFQNGFFWSVALTELSRKLIH
jgi:hypothetical protein